MTEIECPCQEAAPASWTAWEAKYAHENNRLVWQGNFCTICGRNVTKVSRGTYREPDHAHSG
jgi:hypothetical protein